MALLAGLLVLALGLMLVPAIVEFALSIAAGLIAVVVAACLGALAATALLVGTMMALESASLRILLLPSVVGGAFLGIWLIGPKLDSSAPVARREPTQRPELPTVGRVSLHTLSTRTHGLLLTAATAFVIAGAVSVVATLTPMGRALAAGALTMLIVICLFASTLTRLKKAIRTLSECRRNALTAKRLFQACEYDLSQRIADLGGLRAEDSQVPKEGVVARIQREASNLTNDVAGALTEGVKVLGQLGGLALALTGSHDAGHGVGHLAGHIKSSAHVRRHAPIQRSKRDVFEGRVRQSKIALDAASTALGRAMDSRRDSLCYCRKLKSDLRFQLHPVWLVALPVLTGYSAYICASYLVG
jgi:hypothetical protein